MERSVLGGDGGSYCYYHYCSNWLLYWANQHKAKPEKAAVKQNAFGWRRLVAICCYGGVKHFIILFEGLWPAGQANNACTAPTAGECSGGSHATYATTPQNMLLPSKAFLPAADLDARLILPD